MGIIDWFKGTPSTRNIYSGGTGDAANTAIVIGVANSGIGVASEYAYVEKECGQQNVDWFLELQMHTSKDGREFDILTVSLKDGSSRKFWFDITAFYGKF